MYLVIVLLIYSYLDNVIGMMKFLINNRIDLLKIDVNLLNWVDNVFGWLFVYFWVVELCLWLRGGSINECFIYDDVCNKIGVIVSDDKNMGYCIFFL